MFCVFEIAVYLSLRERICSLKNFLLVYVYINKLFTLFRAYRRNRMSMRFPAVARNFLLFIENIGEI